MENWALGRILGVQFFLRNFFFVLVGTISLALRLLLTKQPYT